MFLPLTMFGPRLFAVTRTSKMKKPNGRIAQHWTLSVKALNDCLPHGDPERRCFIT